MDVINELIFILNPKTQDKKVLKYMLEYLISLDKEIINTLNYIFDESKKENKILVFQGVLNILKQKHPEEMKNYIKHIKVERYINKNKDFIKRL